MTIVETVGWVLVHFVWQGAAIAAALWLVLTAARPTRATVRYALGCGTLALMLLAPIVTASMLVRGASPAALDAAAATDARGLLSSLDRGGANAPTIERVASGAIGSGVEATASSSMAGARSAADPAAADLSGRGAVASGAAVRPPDALGSSTPRWTLAPAVRARVAAAMPWLVVVWAIGVLLMSVRLAGGWWRTRVLRTRGISPVPSACQQAAARLLESMRITKPVQVLISARVLAPMVFGHVKPVVLMPAAALAGLSPSQLDAILAHELAHVRRHDYLVNLLQTVIETVLFYHPAVWWVSRQVRTAREECCDDIAVAACGNRREYVEALLGLEQLRLAAMTLALGATDGSLLSRARRILRDGDREGTSPRLTASVIAMAVASLAIAGISTAATEPIVLKSAIEPSSGSVEPSRDPSASARSSSESPASSRDAAASSSASSGSPESAEALAAQTPVQPRSVIAAPDPAAPLANRRAWADREARTQRASRYWIGYAIRPVRGLPPFVYMDQRGAVVSEGMTLSGHFSSRNARGLRFPGQPLVIADADPAALKVLFAFNANGGAPRLTDVHVSTMPLPVDVRDRPVFWLGSAQTTPSFELIDGLWGQASTLELKKDLVNAAEVHEESPVVVAWLDRKVRANEPDDVRAEAVEGLAWHAIPASLAALDRAARQDRATRVRQEAAEAVGDLEMPEAAEALIALAKTLDDHEARREAVEALGARQELSARDALVAIARQDASVDIQREAVESLGDYEDQRGVPALMDLLKTHPNPEVRREVIETIGDAMPNDAAIALLRQTAREDKSPDVQREAVETLGDIDRPEAREAVKDLVRSHTEADVRREAIETMVEHATATEAVAIINDVIQKETNVEVRRDAVERLADIDDAVARKQLIELARTHASEEIRTEAVESLADVHMPAAEIAAVLKQIAMTDRSAPVRLEAVETLADLMAEEAAVVALIDIAREHTEQEVRKEALEALIESKHPRARQLFDRALQRPTGR